VRRLQGCRAVRAPRAVPPPHPTAGRPVCRSTNPRARRPPCMQDAGVRGPPGGVLPAA
jgi:hypothetical protein